MNRWNKQHSNNRQTKRPLICKQHAKMTFRWAGWHFRSGWQWWFPQYRYRGDRNKPIKKKQNKTITEREASLPKHMEDTQTHTCTHTCQRWNTARRAKSKYAPKSIMHFPLRPHLLLHNTKIQCWVGGSNSSTPHCVDNGMKNDDTI